jgi:hypothetical protein
MRNLTMIKEISESRRRSYKTAFKTVAIPILVALEVLAPARPCLNLAAVAAITGGPPLRADCGVGCILSIHVGRDGAMNRRGQSEPLNTRPPDNRRTANRQCPIRLARACDFATPVPGEQKTAGKQRLTAHATL